MCLYGLGNNTIQEEIRSSYLFFLEIICASGEKRRCIGGVCDEEP